MVEQGVDCFAVGRGEREFVEMAERDSLKAGFVVFLAPLRRCFGEEDVERDLKASHREALHEEGGTRAWGGSEFRQSP